MTIKEAIDSAYKVKMYQIREEAWALAGFLSAIKPRNVMEIGTYWGGLFNLLVNLSDPDGIKITVDLNGYYEMDLAVRNEGIKKWGKNVHPIIGNSNSQEVYDKVVNILNGEKLDFLFIDGDHRYEPVKLDYNMYRRVVKDGGWIAFHDINESPLTIKNQCYVSNVWKELTGNKIEFNAMKAPEHDPDASNLWGGIGLIQNVPVV